MTQVQITLTLVAEGPQEDGGDIVGVVQEALDGGLLTLDGVHVESGTVEIDDWSPL